MTSTPQPLLTYESYMAEEYIKKRYDIIDGARIFAEPPTFRHQRMLGHVLYKFGDYERDSKRGEVLFAPFDVLITRNPLRTRQPDVMFMSAERVEQYWLERETHPLSPAPELVVEILSSPDRLEALPGKLADYSSIGVLECWVAHPMTKRTEVLRLVDGKWERAATYGQDEIVTSIVFPGLTVTVNAIFAQ